MEFPQVPGARSSSLAFQAIYWRCIVTFFATSARRNPHCRHLLFSNSQPPMVDGVDIGERLKGLGVEVVSLPITHRIPRGAFGRFGNQFYILDILQYVSRTPIPRVIVLDSDCVWLTGARPIEAAIDRCGVLAYDLGFPVSQVENGVAIADLETLGTALGLPPQRIPPVYAGGEIFAATGEVCRDLLPSIERLWENNLKAIACGEPHVKEEAQFLSLVYLHHGFAMNSANPFIRRIWTTFRYSNSCPADLNLTIWHLPAEKNRGFRRLYEAILDSRSPFSIDRGEAADRPVLAEMFGIPRRSSRKIVADLTEYLGGKGRMLAAGILARADGVIE